MKQMFQTVKEAYQEDPKQVIGGVATVTLLFTSLYAALWVIAILNGTA